MSYCCCSIVCSILLYFSTCHVAYVAGDQPLLAVSCAGAQRIETYTIDSAGKFQPALKLDTKSTPGTSRCAADGRHFYIGASNPPSITVFDVEAQQLTALQTVPVPAKPSYLSITPDGQFLLASYFKTGQVTVHRIDGAGHLSDQPIQQMTLAPRAHCITTDSTGRFVFVAHTTSDCITQLKLNRKTGMLSPNEPKVLQCNERTGPRHLWFHPSNSVAFSSNEQGCSISVYNFEVETGLLRTVQTLPSQPAEASGDKMTTSHVEVHPSGKFVYIANRGHDSIAAFGYDSRQLKLIHRVPSATTTRSFSISPDGRYLVAAGQSSSRLIAYRIDRDGRLNKTDEITCGKKPWWVSFLTTATPTNLTSVSTNDGHRLGQSLALGQGTMSGEVTDRTALLQTRITEATENDQLGDLPGADGFVRFEWSTQKDLTASQLTDIRAATATSDFIVRSKLNGLKPDTEYFYRAHFGADPADLLPGAVCSFRTLPGSAGDREVNFIVGSCMNYIKFMHGRAGNARGPLTATAKDKRLGFPAFATMEKLQPEFFIGTGDIVYYDNPFRTAKTVPELRKCWHEQFRFQRMVDFFRDVPTYWSKDDHDFRYNDSDNASDRIPLPKTGIELFREQLPIAVSGDFDSPNYRTHRVSKHVQIWLTEGRDHRSPNKSPDGPKKTLWGAKQRQWLQSTLAASDAKWKLLISPTPMVGPDEDRKVDNHVNLNGFRHEADEFFAWVQQTGIKNLVLVCGDRHWQYHSVHPTGIPEFSAGALNDENSRLGVAPGDKDGSDPAGKIRQLFTSPQRSGGFLQIKAGGELQMTHFSDDGEQLYQVTLP